MNDQDVMDKYKAGLRVRVRKFGNMEGFVLTQKFIDERRLSYMLNEFEEYPICRELADMQAQLHSLREEMRDNGSETIDLSFTSALGALGRLIEKIMEVENEKNR